MDRVNPRIAATSITRFLEEYLGEIPKHVQPERGGGLPHADLRLRAGKHTFVVEVKTRGDAASVAAGIRHLRALAKTSRAASTTIPLLVVPAMGRVGREICDREGIAWLDLNGNARITSTGIHVWVEGRHAVHKSAPRPKFNPFAPKASRIPRVLLSAPDRRWTQKALVDATGLDKGLVSNVTRQLVADGQLNRDKLTGTLSVVDPNVLLDSWREVYDFSRHSIEYGLVAARSGPALLERASTLLAAAGLRVAATGLAGASLLAPFASYRTVTLYVDHMPDGSLQEKLGFREERTGSNLWLVVPNDSGVYQDSKIVRGVPCVNPIQCYLDLAAQPERAVDAARALRERRLAWKLPVSRATANSGS